MITFLNKEQIDNTIEIIAQQLLLVAHTAPKGKGIDTLSICMLDGEDKNKLATEMEKIANAQDLDFFARDAENIRTSSTVILLGTNSSVRGLNCGYCGHQLCSSKPKNQPCTFNTIDLGIAIGAVASAAINYKLDNRIMFSAGRAAKELNFFDENTQIIFAIPLSASAKNIFFDMIKK